ncbi:DUF6234 family protein [Streptomyces fructofermentans]
MPGSARPHGLAWSRSASVPGLVVAFIFWCSACPFAGAVQLLSAAVALVFTIAAWQDEYECAHPPPPPTRAGMAHSPSQQTTDE